MKTNILKYVSTVIITLALFACNDKKNFGDTATEIFAISSITIAPSEFDAIGDTLVMLMNQTANLSCTIQPADATNPKIVWSISDESVASITQDGKLTSKNKIGTAVLRVTPEIGFGPIAATPAKIVKVIDHFTFIQSITVTNPPTDDIAVGEDYQLTASATPANATFVRYKWTSSNTAVATVDEKGVITGVGSGVATITATADDQNPGTPASTSIQISVKEIIPIEDIQLVADNEIMQLGYGEEYQIKFNLTPADATASLIRWSSDNPAFISVDKSGKLTVKTLAAGTATISASYGSITKTIVASIAEGRLWYSLANTVAPWAPSTAGATAAADGTKTVISLALTSGKFRGDFNLLTNGSGITMNVTPATYRYLAIKVTPPTVLVAGSNSAGCIKLEMWDNNPRTIGPTFTGGGTNANNKYTILNASAISTTSPNILYFDLQAGYDQVNPTDWTRFTLLQFKFVIADYPATCSGLFDIYWVRSFKTVEDLQIYVANGN